MLLISLPSVSAEVVFDNGPNDFPNGQDTGLILGVDDFEVSQNTFLTDAHFFTFEDPAFTNWDGTLDYFIYTDSGNMPENLIGSGSGQNIVKTEVTGTFVPSRPNAIHFEYSFDLVPPVHVESGVRYWFGLHLDQNFVLNHVYWQDTNSQFGNDRLFTTVLPPVWIGAGEDRAFFLTGDDAIIGGKIIPIETTSLILAGAQSFSWMIPLMLSVLGIGLFVVSRKSE